MKRLLCCLLLLISATVFAEETSSVPMVKAPVDLRDQASLQRGAKYFVNYCQGCHALQYLRYTRMAKDIGIVDEGGNPNLQLLQENLILGPNRPWDSFQVAMKPEDAEKWFGMVPPDLSLVARVRGPDWLYNYLRGFYVDPNRPWGMNNVVFKDTAMPAVLVNLQGLQVPVYRTETRMVDGKPEQVKIIDHLELVAPGLMTPQQYDQMVDDLVSFLVYTSEPMQIERQRLGVWVMLFMLIFVVLTYFLKKSYWDRKTN